MKKYILIFTTALLFLNLSFSNDALFNKLYGVSSKQIKIDNFIEPVDHSFKSQQMKDAFDDLFPDHVYAKTKLINDNMQAWYTRWYLLSRAKKTFDCTAFVFKNDIFGKSFLGLLLKKAQEGVKIRLMLSSRGSKKFLKDPEIQAMFQELLKTENIIIKQHNPLKVALKNRPKLYKIVQFIRNLMAGNHDKIFIVDGHFVVGGGRNIGKDYMSDVRDNKTARKDTDFVLDSSKIAKQMKIAFDEEFIDLRSRDVKIKSNLDVKNILLKMNLNRKIMKRWIDGLGLYPAKSENQEIIKIVNLLNDEIKKFSLMTNYQSYSLFSGERLIPAMVIDKHSAAKGTKNDITPNLIAMINACEKEIIIQNQYLVLTKEARKALQAANDRGVKIYILTNSPASGANSIDSLATQAIFLREWRELITSMPNLKLYGVEANYYYLHTKVFVFDQVVTAIGSYNMDYVSDKTDSEIITVFKSKSFAIRNRFKFQEELKHAVRYTQDVTPESHATKKRIKKLKWLGKIFKYLRPLI
ncbi:MAG: hypothetical protein COB02_00460 [Candidatus Cloacimonadota bacterium]|nr:MAG: hypothetical protein COB02_00460 [Candidatus Cloacimonadota bacterium]